MCACICYREVWVTTQQRFLDFRYFTSKILLTLFTITPYLSNHMLETDLYLCCVHTAISQRHIGDYSIVFLITSCHVNDISMILDKAIRIFDTLFHSVNHYVPPFRSSGTRELNINGKLVELQFVALNATEVKI